MKSAVRTLRVLSDSLGLSGKIGIYGFSRGSDAGSMAIGDRSDSIVDNAGFNIGISDDVQAAALGSGVFDFTQIYNTTDDGDGNLETRCPWVWGPLADNYELWQSMGSAYFVETSATAPVLFFYNTSDNHYYQDQIAQLKAKLDLLGVPTSTVIDYGTGHAVPQTSAALSQLYTFFNQYLKTEDDSTQSGIGAIDIVDGYSDDKMLLTLTPNPATDEMQINFNLTKAGNVKIELYNLWGIIVFKTEKRYDQTGLKSDTISLDELALPQGTYYVKVASEGMQGITKFLKEKS